MTEYKINCQKCTATAISQDGSLYCKPCLDGKKTIYLQDNGNGIDLVCCDEYTTEPRQEELYMRGGSE